MDSWLRPVQLEGELVKLVPLQKTHKVDLAFAASDGKLWELWYTENLNCIAVEFRTHFHNHPSRNAILRLGAKQDGILRNHRVDEHGNLRDTVVFSILDSEWKTVKTSLEFKMTRSYLG